MGPLKKLLAVVQALGCLYSATNFAANAGCGFFAASWHPTNRQLITCHPDRSSPTLTPVLLEHGLADEVLLLVYPILLGTGKRFFSDGTPPRELTLVGSKAGSSGVIISTYRPNGPLRTGTMGE